MTTAHFQPLTWRMWYRLTGWMVGIIRVYAIGGYDAKSDFKFGMGVSIWRGLATLHSLGGTDREVRIVGRDRLAMAACLSKIGALQATWIHDGKPHFYKLR